MRLVRDDLVRRSQKKLGTLARKEDLGYSSQRPFLSRGKGNQDAGGRSSPRGELVPLSKRYRFFVDEIGDLCEDAGLLPVPFLSEYSSTEI